MELMNIKKFNFGELIFTTEVVRFVNGTMYKLFIDYVRCSECLKRQNFVIYNWKNILKHLEEMAKESLECTYIKQES